MRVVASWHPLLGAFFCFIFAHLARWNAAIFLRAAADIRAGRRCPHPRHWAGALAIGRHFSGCGECAITTFLGDDSETILQSFRQFFCGLAVLPVVAAPCSF